MSGFTGDRVGDAVASWFASLSVTEMIANRGSTASLKVRATYDGGVLST